MRSLWTLVRREIARDSWRARAFVFRALIATLLCIPVVWVFVEMQSRALPDARAFGFRLLGMMVQLMFFLTLLLGPATSSAALARERANKTFESLRVSGLSIFTITLGKTFGAFGNLLDKFSLGLPMFGIAALLGASFVDFLLPVLPVLLGFALLTCALGSCFGLMVKKPLTATVLAYLVTFLYFTVGVLFAGEVGKEARVLISPLHAILLAGTEAGSWWRPTLLYVVATVGLSLVSTALHGLVSDSWLSHRLRRKTTLLGKGRSLGRFPVFRYNVRGSVVVYLLLLVLVFLGDLALVLVQRQLYKLSLDKALLELNNPQYQAFSLGLLVTALQLVMLLRGCQLIANERAANTFTVLATTPVTGLRYCFAKVSALTVYALPGLALIGVRLAICYGLGRVETEHAFVRSASFLGGLLYYAMVGLALSAWLGTALRASVVGLLFYLLHGIFCACCQGGLSPFAGSYLLFSAAGRGGQGEVVMVLNAVEIFYDMVGVALLLTILVATFDRMLARLTNSDRQIPPSVELRSRLGPPPKPGGPVPPPPQGGPPPPDWRPPGMGPPQGPPQGMGPPQGRVPPLPPQAPLASPLAPAPPLPPAPDGETPPEGGHDGLREDGR